jgi:hypothetical protein
MTTDMAKYFPLLFIAGWVLVTTILAFLSGWFSLMARYPDRNEMPLLKMRWQSGSMGIGVNMNGLLMLAICPSGIRIGMFRIFGLFCRDFFVPWDELSVSRSESWLFGGRAKLIFGSTGSLTVMGNIADRLARALPGCWPETTLPPAETRKDLFLRLGKLWLLGTMFASAFFIAAPRLLAPGTVAPPIVVAILFPAIALGLTFLLQYWLQARHLPVKGHEN